MGGGQAGRDSSARAESSKSLEKPGMETRNAHCEEAPRIWTKRVFGCLGPVFLCSGKAAPARLLQRPHAARLLNGFAPHPSAGSRTGAASEPGCTLVSYKTVPPFSLPFLLLTANRERWSGIWPTGSLVLALNTTLLQAHLPSPSWHRMK